MKFKPIEQIEPDINSAEEFAESDFAGVLTLIGVPNYKDLVFASTADEDDVTECYYFLEGNADHLKRQDNLLLVLMDEIRFVLLDFHDSHAIAVHKNHKAIAEELLL